MNAITDAVLHQPDTHALLWRGALYEALALAFSYPDAETLADLDDALDGLSGHEVTAGWDGRDALAALVSARTAAAPTSLAGAHTGLFAGDAPCAACETAYERDAFAKARQLADIAGFYRAFGLKVATGRPGPADFIATELEFISHLLLREAYAAMRGWEEQRQVCEQARRAFLEDHLGRWVEPLCAAVRDHDRTAPFYSAAATLCERFVRAEIDAAGLRPRPADGRWSDADDARPFTCMFAAPAEHDDEEGQP